MAITEVLLEVVSDHSGREPLVLQECLGNHYRPGLTLLHRLNRELHDYIVKIAVNRFSLQYGQKMS